MNYKFELNREKGMLIWMRKFYKEFVKCLQY